MKLCAFLKSHGGLRDCAGELRAMDLHLTRPGLVNNKSGMYLDEATEIARDAGYLVDSGAIYDGCSDLDSRDLLEAIDQELRGWPCYPIGEYHEPERLHLPPFPQPASREYSLWVAAQRAA